MSVLIEKVRPFWVLMRMPQPVGIWLVLWPALIGLVLASAGHPSWSMVVIFVLGSVLMRAAGCVVNDFADRNIDGFVARTAQRPLATGQLQPRQALYLLVVLLFLAANLLWFLNLYSIILACFAVALAVFYPFSKRFFVCPQAILGAAFAQGFLLAFAAVQNQLPLSVWPWFIGFWSWIIAYDTQYAMVDREDDKKISIFSSAIWFENNDRLFIILLQLLSGVCWAYAGWQSSLAAVYYWGLLVVMLMFAYQDILVWKRQRDKCFRAFKQNVWLGAVLLLSVVLGMH